MIARLRAAAPGAPSRATPSTTAAPLAADVFNHDTDGLPQNEESVAVCGRTVLGGTNDFRGFLLTPPQGMAAGWHLSTNGGRTLRNEGLLPPVTIAGQPVPAHGDPVDVAGKGCSLYASSLNSTPDDRLQGIAVYRSRPETLASCPGGPAAACWPTSRAVATAELPHFLDKEWMDVGRSGRAGEVVWVSFTDFTLDPTTGELLSSTIKAVRCNAGLTICIDPILVSGSDHQTQFSHITVGPDGRTYLTWVDFQFPPETGPTMVIKLRVARRPAPGLDRPASWPPRPSRWSACCTPTASWERPRPSPSTTSRSSTASPACSWCGSIALPGSSGHHQDKRRCRPVRGTRVAGVGTRVGTRVGTSVPTSVGVQGLAMVVLGWDRQGCGACQRRSTRRRRVPSRPPTVADKAWSRGRPSSTNGCAVRSCAAAGCRTFALDGRASRPDNTTSLPASLVASMPRGDIPLRKSSSALGHLIGT